MLAGLEVPAAALLLPAAVMSAASSQLGSCARARWSALLAERPAEVPRAYAWEAVVDEVVFVVGPLLVVLAAVVDPAVGLLGALALGSAGTLALVAQHGTEPAVSPRHGGRRPSALGSAGLRTLTGVMLFVGVLFGTVEVTMVAFAEERGSSGSSGVLLALVAGGSAAAGLLYGAVHWRAPAPTRLVLALGVLAVGLVPLLLAPGVALMAPAALLAGFAISPTLIAAFGLLEDLVPVAARTEGFSWLNSGLGVGVAAGFAGSGAVAEARAPGRRSSWRSGARWRRAWSRWPGAGRWSPGPGSPSRRPEARLRLGPLLRARRQQCRVGQRDAREDLVHLRDQVVVERRPRSGRVVADLLGPGRAHDGGRHVRVLQHPLDGELGQRQPGFVGEGLQLLHRGRGRRPASSG